MKREYLYKLVDTVPNDKLIEVERMLKIMAMPEEVPTEEELEAIRLGEEEYARGEYTTYTPEELVRKFLND